MGLFSRKKNKPQGNTSMAARSPGYVPPPQGNDPSLPGLAGWCGSDKARPLPHRFNYVRPDGRPEDPKRFWADPDDPQWS